MHLRMFTFIAGLLMNALAAFSQSTQTLTGTVSDSMCGAKHMETSAFPLKSSGSRITHFRTPFFVWQELSYEKQMRAAP